MPRIKFDLVSHNGNDLYLTSAIIMNFLEVMDHLGIIEMNSAFHSEGALYVNIE
jgi:hypothetical protein